MSYDDWDFHPFNVIAIAAALVVAFAFLIFNAVAIQHSIDVKETKIKQARYEACGKINDEALRILCVSRGE